MDKRTLSLRGEIYKKSLKVTADIEFCELYDDLQFFPRDEKGK